MLKTPINCIILAEGVFRTSARNCFKVPPPTDFFLEGDLRTQKKISPHQKFTEKPCILHILHKNMRYGDWHKNQQSILHDLWLLEVYDRFATQPLTRYAHILMVLTVDTISRTRNAGGHTTLEVTGVLGQQLKTRGLLVRDFSEKWSHSVRRPNKGGQMLRIRQIFCVKYKFGHIFDKNFEKKKEKLIHVSKKRVIQWEIVKNWLRIIKKMGSLGESEFKKGVIWWAQVKKGSMGESELKKGVIGWKRVEKGGSMG